MQHTHQKGIIHRELRPTNILVESQDGKPVPKLIDFGLAKATSSMRLSEHSLFTAFGTVAGTPLYMAPEAMGVSRATAFREWAYARSWLATALDQAH